MSKTRILVIDDEPGVTRNIKLNLEATGEYEVRTDNHGTHAVAAARNFRPDLVLLDVMMPDIDGGDVAAQMKADPLLSRIPVVFLTAIVSKRETQGKEWESGEQSFLAKPADLHELRRCIEHHLRRA